MFATGRAMVSRTVKDRAGRRSAGAARAAARRAAFISLVGLRGNFVSFGVRGFVLARLAFVPRASRWEGFARARGQAWRAQARRAPAPSRWEAVICP